jgi:uncharacterized protein involved in high-affinity Fe2+ transport
MSICRFALLPFTALLAISPLQAKEYPIDEPQERGGMEVGAVYLQPIEMDPQGMMRAAAESDVHIEAYVRALENNPKMPRREYWSSIEVRAFACTLEELLERCQITQVARATIDALWALQVACDQPTT